VDGEWSTPIFPKPFKTTTNSDLSKTRHVSNHRCSRQNSGVLNRTFKITVAYDGTDFAGWQVQPDLPTIQCELESALKEIVGHKVTVVGSGRTDSGVHAIGQVASFILDHWNHSAEQLVKAINTKLPPSIVVTQGTEVASGFHAIRDAVSKRYRYQIQTDGPADPFSLRDRWRLRWPVNVEAMSAAAQYFVGEHDFASFQATGADRKSTVRTVQECVLVRQTDPTGLRTFIAIEVEANGFLYNMVRNIVGTIVEVGRGKHEPTWIPEVLGAKNRSVAGSTAPAHGLILLWVNYGEAS
jgi:tRNA pseudouridine38-40 synthase